MNIVGLLLLFQQLSELETIDEFIDLDDVPDDDPPPGTVEHETAPTRRSGNSDELNNLLLALPRSTHRTRQILQQLTAEYTASSSDGGDERGVQEM